jgi:hypothetical protein
LELKIGEEITYPIYLSPKVLQRKEICKGITLESEEEIFVDRPVSEKNAKKELNKRLNELEDLRGKISEKDNEIIMLKEKLQGKELELGNYAHISNKDWEEDYKNRPTRKELDEVKQKMNNPILSMINCVLDNNEAGELKNYFLELLELVEKLDFSQQGCERKAAAKLIKSFFLLSKKNNQ